EREPDDAGTREPPARRTKRPKGSLNVVVDQHYHEEGDPEREANRPGRSRTSPGAHLHELLDRGPAAAERHTEPVHERASFERRRLQVVVVQPCPALRRIWDSDNGSPGPTGKHEAVVAHTDGSIKRAKDRQHFGRVDLP